MNFLISPIITITTTHAPIGIAAIATPVGVGASPAYAGVCAMAEMPTVVFAVVSGEPPSVFAIISFVTKFIVETPVLYTL